MKQDKRPFEVVDFLPKRAADAQQRDADLSARIKAFFAPKMKRGK